MQTFAQLKQYLLAFSVLLLGMGIGRFLFTPMLPVMLNEGTLSLSQLSIIASSNYAGYLLGSLLLSFGPLSHNKDSKNLFILSCFATAIFILAMAITNDYYILLIIRFLAGIASAGCMVFGSAILLQHTNKKRIVGSMFAGIGIGIFLGNEYIEDGKLHHLSAAWLWIGSGVFALILAIIITMLLPQKLPGKNTQRTEPGDKNKSVSWKYLLIMYGFAGFGYIITATYLPLMAKSFQQPVLAAHLWSITGIGIFFGSYIWIWLAHVLGSLRALTLNLFLQALCVVAIILPTSSLLLVISSFGFGATFMGTCAIAMPFSRTIAAPNNVNLLASMALTYGIGQIAGPLVTNMLLSIYPASIIPAILIATLSLLIAALINHYLLDKKYIPN